MRQGDGSRDGNVRIHNSVTITGMDRPDLFRQALQTLSSNDLDGWRIHIRIEPTERSRQFVEIAAATLPAGSYRLDVNRERLGIRRNPRAVIDDAFAGGSLFNLHVEEDLLLAPDATAMARWFESHHRPHWLCLSLLAGPCGWPGMLSNPGFPDSLLEMRVFNSIGFAFRKAEWLEYIRPAWEDPTTPAHHPASPGQWRTHWGWDWSVYGSLLAKPKLRTVQPILARATHNGPVGTYSTAEFHDRAFTGLPLHDGQAVDYRLVDRIGLPFEVRSHLNGFDAYSETLLEMERMGRRLIEPVARTAIRRVKHRIRSIVRRGPSGA
jgi:hypothetical protein